MLKPLERDGEKLRIKKQQNLEVKIMAFREGLLPSGSGFDSLAVTGLWTSY